MILYISLYRTSMLWHLGQRTGVRPSGSFGIVNRDYTPLPYEVHLLTLLWRFELPDQVTTAGGNARSSAPFSRASASAPASRGRRRRRDRSTGALPARQVGPEVQRGVRGSLRDRRSGTLEDTCMEHALEGFERPVIWQGILSFGRDDQGNLIRDQASRLVSLTIRKHSVELKAVHAPGHQAHEVLTEPSRRRPRCRTRASHSYHHQARSVRALHPLTPAEAQRSCAIPIGSPRCSAVQSK